VDERWRMLTRIRQVRAQLALNEAMRARSSQRRAQAALEQARTRQTQLREQAERAVGTLAEGTDTPGEAFYEAGQAQQLLGFVAALRSRAQEAAVQVRRAQTQCARAQETVSGANTKYRREAGRRDAVQTQWQERLRAARRQELGREEATRLDERNGSRIAQRLREADDFGGKS
jgi:hypothetical protein